MLLDDRVDPPVFEGLRALGHHAVGADGELHGGADPFTPAAAVGIVA